MLSLRLALLYAALNSLFNAPSQAFVTQPRGNASCRCMPGDSCWPKAQDWANLNSTVQGRLIAITPLGSPCHDPTYDVAACELLKQEWIYAPIQFDTHFHPR